MQKEKQKQIVKHRQEATGVRCIGDICYDQATGKIRIELGKATCNVEQLDRIRELLVEQADTEVEWVIPAKSTKKASVKQEAE